VIFYISCVRRQDILKLWLPKKARKLSSIKKPRFTPVFKYEITFNSSGDKLTTKSTSANDKMAQSTITQDVVISKINNSAYIPGNTKYI